VKQPEGVDAFVSTRRKTSADIVKEVSAVYQPVAASNPSRSKHYALTPLVDSYLLRLFRASYPDRLN
jgi:hypothetical protein